MNAISKVDYKEFSSMIMKLKQPHATLERYAVSGGQVNLMEKEVSLTSVVESISCTLS